jgi:DNA-binding NtrC family response regulator
MAATHRDLETEVHEDRFREDLFYRLRVVEIRIPPLRERTEDIVPLARFFTQRLAARLEIPNLTLDARCLEVLESYPWPGNVRELENALERAAVMSVDGHIVPEHLPSSVRDPGARAPAASGDSLAAVEHEHILRVLRRAGGNRTRAARILGISSTTLWRKLKRAATEPRR